jgi:thiol-disulfide isomerase/thioredoxin
MKNTILLIAFFLGIFKTFSQNHKLKILKKNDLLSFSISMSIVTNEKKGFKKDSVIVLQNGIELGDYKIFEKVIQNVTVNKYNTINFLVGYTFTQMVMVADNNHNRNFSDDSVYTYKIQKDQINNRQFRNSLPQIKLDSLEVIDKNGIPFYYSTSIKFCPTLKPGSQFSSYFEMPKSKNLGMIIFSDSSYYTENFFIGTNIYHLEFIPHSFIYPVYPIDNSDQSWADIVIIKHLEKDSMKLVGSLNVEYMLLRNKEMNFEDKSLKINKYDFTSKVIDFVIDKETNKVSKNLEYLSNNEYISLKDMKKHTIQISEKKYTVLEFGGSWCKPCKEIIPQMEKFHKNSADTVKVISIFKENNLEAALQYFKKTKPKWDVYFESLKCDTAGCFSQILNIGPYPTLFLLNKSGTVLFKDTGSDCIKNVEKFLKNDIYSTKNP